MFLSGTDSRRREPLKGALNEQELASMKAAAEEYRFVAEAKRTALRGHEEGR